MKFIFTLAFMLSFLLNDLSATHIVAGFSTYKHLSDNRYEIKFTLVRDQLSGGALSDNEIVVQVYTFNGAAYTFQNNIITPRSNIFEVEFGSQASIATQTNISLEAAEYTFDFGLSDPEVDYLFVFQRCCRTPTLLNIADPNENGITLISTISKEAQAIQNSSIEFDILPSFLAIVNQEQTTAINALSIDGDTLSYQFSPSYNGGGDDGATGIGDPTSCTGVTPHGPCPPPYQQVEYSFDETSFITPFPEWADQGMNATNGTLEGIPSLLGHYAYGFSIHESRNGQIINTTSFDYAIYVLPFTSSTENLHENKLKVHGNPSNDGFIVESDTDKKLNYEVYNLEGKKINTTIGYEGNTVKIDFEGHAGMYILKAFNETTNQSIRLIKL